MVEVGVYRDHEGDCGTSLIQGGRGDGQRLLTVAILIRDTMKVWLIIERYEEEEEAKNTSLVEGTSN